MPTVSDYAAGLRAVSPYIDVNHPDLQGELQHQSDLGTSVNDVVQHGIAQGAYDPYVKSGAQNYLSSQYQPQLDAAKGVLTTADQAAQSGADFQSQQAQIGNDRLVKQLDYLYQQRKNDDPLTRQGIVSGASQNYQTDQQAQNYQYANQDLSTTLSGIAKSLAASKAQDAAQYGATSGTIGGQISSGLTDILNNSRQAATVGAQTPFGTSYTVGGQTYAGQNQGLGLLNLLQNPSLVRLASNQQTLPLLKNMLAPYGIDVVDDVFSGAGGTPAATPASPGGYTTPQPATPATTPAAPAAPDLGAVKGYISNIFKDHGSPAGYTENTLIPYITKQYGLSPSQASDLVYPIRNQVLGN